MLTNPSTLGLFDEGIEEVTSVVHEAGGPLLLRRRQPERGLRDLTAGRHGLRRRPLQPPQDVSPAARRRRPGRRARSPCGRRSSRSCPCPVLVRREDGTFDLERDRPRSVGKVRGLPRARSASSCAPTPSSARTARGCARCPRPPCSTRTTCSPGSGTPTTFPTTGCACTSSCFSAQSQARARRHRAGRRQAADGLRLSPADHLLPARRAGGADDRADRDGDEGDARRVLSTRCCAIAPRGRATPGAAREAPHSRPVGGSTRCGR